MKFLKVSIKVAVVAVGVEAVKLGGNGASTITKKYKQEDGQEKNVKITILNATKDNDVDAVKKLLSMKKVDVNMSNEKGSKNIKPFCICC